jgi:hypothetical protein
MHVYNRTLDAYLGLNSRATRFAKVDAALEAAQRQLELEKGISDNRESSLRESSKTPELSRSQLNATAKIISERAELDATALELVKGQSKLDMTKLKLVTERKVSFSNNVIFSCYILTSLYLKALENDKKKFSKDMENDKKAQERAQEKIIRDAEKVNTALQKAAEAKLASLNKEIEKQVIIINLRLRLYFNLRCLLECKATGYCRFECLRSDKTQGPR